MPILKSFKYSKSVPKEKPILFTRKKDGAWGTIALQGPHAKNSILDNIIFEGGSGDMSGNIKYTGSLSIHDTKNIIIKNKISKKLIINKGTKFLDEKENSF